MTLNDANEISSILQLFLERDILFAIGGRQSLIIQKVLKDLRPIGDIDLNVIIGPDRGFPMSTVEYGFRAVQRALRSHYKDLNCNVEVGGLRQSGYGEGGDSDDDADDDNEGIDTKSGDDAFLSISITMAPKPPKVTRTPTSAGIELKWIDPFMEAPIVRGLSDFVTTTNAASTVQFTSTGTDWVDFGVTSRQQVVSEPAYTYTKLSARDVWPPYLATSFEDVMNMKMKECAPRLGELVLQNGGLIKVDLFPLYEKFPTNRIKVIGDRFFVSPYVILKAKYKYCRDPNTNITMFHKHLEDLRQSFESIRIRGINYPEDTEALYHYRVATP